MSYYITTDATCDYPEELPKFENFKIIPMTYTIGDTEYGIDKNLTGKEVKEKYIYLFGIDEGVSI